MSPNGIFIAVLLLSATAYYLGRRRAFAVGKNQGGIRYLHSRPAYHGALTALWCGIPALIVFICWLAFEGKIITNLVIGDLPEAIRSLPPDRLNLVVNDVKNLVTGNILPCLMMILLLFEQGSNSKG